MTDARRNELLDLNGIVDRYADRLEKYFKKFEDDEALYVEVTWFLTNLNYCLIRYITGESYRSKYSTFEEALESICKELYEDSVNIFTLNKNEPK